MKLTTSLWNDPPNAQHLQLLQTSMLIAITRKVSDRIAQCELTHVDRQPINLSLAREQHDTYERCLAELGCKVQSLPAEFDLPDSVFVED
ncbi:hypothetical protein JNM05_04530, partial [bacterium]|nr:hypothetical protein [bacterium]